MKLKFVLGVLTLLLCNTLFAQNKFAGTWNGQLKIVDTIRLVLHISESIGGSYIGTLDSPDQNVFGIKCDKVEVNEIGMNATLTFSVDKLKVSYTGKFINDSTLSGTFSQGVTIPLELHKTYTETVKKEIK